MGGYPRRAGAVNPQSSWARWNVDQGLAQLIANSTQSITLDGTEQVFYDDELHYGGHVCLFVGYIVDNTLVFGGQPITYQGQ